MLKTVFSFASTKAWVAALIAGLTAFLVEFEVYGIDGLTTQEWVIVIVAFIVAFAGTWSFPNKEASG